MGFRLVNGKLLLSNGRPFICTIGEAPTAPSGMTSLTASPFVTGNPLSAFTIQRKAGSIYGNVPFIGTFEGTLSPSIQGRVEDQAGNVVKDWATLSNVSVLGNQFVGYLTDVRQNISLVRKFRDGSKPNDTACQAADGKAFGIGVTVGMHGQSNMLNALNYGFNDPTGSGDGEYDHSLTTAARARYSKFAFNGFEGAAATGQLIIGRLLAKKLEEFYGYPVPVCVVPWAVNGSGIEEWNGVGGYLDQLWSGTGTTGGTTGFKSPLTIQPGGDVEIVCFDLGESANGAARATFTAEMVKFYQFMLDRLAQFGRTADNFSLLFSMLGSYGDNQVNNAQRVRGAQLDFDAYAKTHGWPNARLSNNRIDLDPENNDGLHFSNSPVPYQKWQISRFIQSAYKALGLSSFDGAGPRLISAVRNGLVITLTFNLNGGTALIARNGGAPTGMTLNTAADFTGTNIACTAAIASANTVTLTMPSGTTTAQLYLMIFGGAAATRASYHPDMSNPLCNNATYPEGSTGPDLILTGIPALPTPDAIPVT